MRLIKASFFVTLDRVRTVIIILLSILLIMIFTLTLLATGLALLAEGKYILSIFQGKTKPSFSGWLIFTISMSCVLASAYALGARESLFLIATFTLLHAFVTIFSLKYGIIRFTKVDIFLLILSAIGVFLWWQTSSPWYALILNILIDTFGYIALVKKLYYNPGTEDGVAWAMSIGAYGLNLFLISRWIPEEYLFSLSNVIYLVLHYFSISS